MQITQLFHCDFLWKMYNLFHGKHIFFWKKVHHSVNMIQQCFQSKIDLKCCDFIGNDYLIFSSYFTNNSWIVAFTLPAHCTYFNPKSIHAFITSFGLFLLSFSPNSLLPYFFCCFIQVLMIAKQANL